MLLNKNNQNINLEALKNCKSVSINGNSNTISICDSSILVHINGNGNTIFFVHALIQLNIYGNGNIITCLQSQVKVKVQGNGNQLSSEQGSFTCLSCMGFGNIIPENRKMINNKNNNKQFSSGTDNDNNYNQKYPNDFVNMHNFQNNRINTNQSHFNNSSQMQYKSNKNMNGPFQNIFSNFKDQNQSNIINCRNSMNNQINQNKFSNNKINPFKHNIEIQKQMQQYNERVKKQQQKIIKQQQKFMNIKKKQIKKRDYSPMEIQHADFPVIESKNNVDNKQLDFFKKQQQNRLQMKIRQEQQFRRKRQVQQNMNLFANRIQINRRQNLNRQEQIQSTRIQKDEEPLSQTQIARILISPHIGQQVECSICLIQIYKNDQEIYLSCCHSFHAFCVSSWLKKSAKCPICNESVRQGFKHSY